MAPHVLRDLRAAFCEDANMSSFRRFAVHAPRSGEHHGDQVFEAWRSVSLGRHKLPR